MKFGYVCIVGRANAGKSTLVNALVGEKVSIVSYKPQTTRNKIIGIINSKDYQIALIDTPGIFKPHNKLGEYMMTSVSSSMKDVEAVVYVIDGSKGVCAEDENFIEKQLETNIPLLIVVNKIDTITDETLFQVLAKLNTYSKAKAIMPVSAKKSENGEKIVEQLISYLNEEDKIYPEDMYTDSSVRFMVAEIIREKALYLLSKELPYGIGIEITTFEYNEDKNLYDINVDIICERQSHKSIIIGKKGAMLKEIASKARVDIEKLLDAKVFLTMYVKVKENWRDSNYLLKELNYNMKDLEE